MCWDIRKGILQITVAAHSDVDIAALGKMLCEAFDRATEIGGDLLTGLYGQTGSVAYEVLEGHGDITEILRQFSEAYNGEIIFTYAHRDMEGSFFKEVIKSGKVSVTSFCNNNAASILHLMMWGSDEADIQE